MSKSICVTSILTCKETFIINLFENIVCCAITFLCRDLGNVRSTVLPRSNLTHAVRSRFVRFAAAVRAVRGYDSCGLRLRFVRFAVTVRAVSGRGSCGSRLRFMRFLS